MLVFEALERFRKSDPWDRIIRRNAIFQQEALNRLSAFSSQLPAANCQLPTLFAYSYAALDLFRFAKSRGWQTVLGQIDPGPEEERIVVEEHRRYAHLKSAWQPAPKYYWDSWREETRLADRIIVNSEWSRECLIKEGVTREKIEVIPLVYRENAECLNTKDESRAETQRRGPGDSNLKSDQALDTRHSTLVNFSPPSTPKRPLRLLFLGQINLRKGVGRLLDAMRILKNEPVELTLVGPSDLAPSPWADLSNVRWFGPVPRSNVGRHYSEADAFILPTLSDGFALTQLEAQSHGLPLIASKFCGHVVDDEINGMLLESLEPEDLAKDIRKCAASPEWFRSGMVPSAFTLEDLAGMVNRPEVTSPTSPNK
jgi:glycosyltransferase involved in cell wall biosynthesis